MRSALLIPHILQIVSCCRDNSAFIFIVATSLACGNGTISGYGAKLQRLPSRRSGRTDVSTQPGRSQAASTGMRQKLRIATIGKGPLTRNDKSIFSTFDPTFLTGASKKGNSVDSAFILST
jgi:hypothetical protein